SLIPCAGAYACSRFLRTRIVPPALPFGREKARESGAIGAELERLGRRIGPYDLMVAGQGRARNLTVVTANTREFERVAGLSIEDWAQPN
ncbi:MAG: hypothetical protein OXS50_06690, partial [Gammaproteobacteria bacterium]|nr:hypothetical protein [Gammaproteobacteria bacterium]